MAKIVLNASLSKYDKKMPSGIAGSVQGERNMGVLDMRETTYTDQHLFYAGLTYDKDKKILRIIDNNGDSNANLGVFISTYPIELVEGRMIINEYMEASYEISSICFKRDNDGYKKEEKENLIFKGLYEIKPKKVAFYVAVVTGKERTIIKNSQGFMFVCDFNKSNWFTLKPNSSKLDLYNYNGDIEIKDLMRDKLPFPGLDRKLFDEEVSKLEEGNLDVVKHALKNV